MTSTDRTHYRALVAEMAAKAKDRLPESVNGRIEAAVKLVLSHDVEPQDDGTILVGSSTDPLKQYRLEGTSCECQDFTRGQAPDGWCQHRIAAGLQRRVQELLAAQAGTQVYRDHDGLGNTDSTSLPEAPASVNCYLAIDGRQVQLTLRDRDEGRLLERLAVVLRQYPQPPPAPQGASPQRTGVQEIGWCQKHQCGMTLNDKNGKQWWSHHTADGWCKGK
jgi:hypothetical protein